MCVCVHACVLYIYVCGCVCVCVCEIGCTSHSQSRPTWYQVIYNTRRDPLSDLEAAVFLCDIHRNDMYKTQHVDDKVQWAFYEVSVMCTLYHLHIRTDLLHDNGTCTTLSCQGDAS